MNPILFVTSFAEIKIYNYHIVIQIMFTAQHIILKNMEVMDGIFLRNTYVQRFIRFVNQ